MNEKLLVILPKYDSQSPDHLEHLLEMIRLWNEKLNVTLLFENLNNPKISDIETDFPGNANGIPSLILRTVRLISLRLRGYKVCFVYYSYWGAIIASIIFRLSGGKVYYWHCEKFNDFYKPEESLAKTITKWVGDKLLLILTLHIVSGLITGPESVAKSYSKIFKISLNKIHVIPNWINISRFENSEPKRLLRKKLNLSKSRKVILFVHKLVPRKGADYLPEIIKLITSKTKNVEFVIVGSGDLLVSLRRKISTLKLNKNVQFHGAVPNRLIAQYYHASDLFIMPSRQEGFPRVILECMACSLPFVSFDVGGTQQIIPPVAQSYLVEPGNLDSFVQNCVTLLRSREKYRKFKNDANKHVRKYNIRIVSKLFINLFNQ